MVLVGEEWLDKSKFLYPMFTRPYVIFNITIYYPTDSIKKDSIYQNNFWRLSTPVCKLPVQILKISTFHRSRLLFSYQKILSLLLSSRREPSHPPLLPPRLCGPHFFRLFVAFLLMTRFTLLPFMLTRLLGRGHQPSPGFALPPLPLTHPQTAF